MLNAQSIAAHLLPSAGIHSAAFGVAWEATDRVSILEKPVGLNLTDAPSDIIDALIGESSNSILAVGDEDVFLIRSGADPRIESFGIYDLVSRTFDSKEHPAVRLTSNAILAERLNVSFQADFRLTANPPWDPKGLGENLTRAINLGGDPLKSMHPLIRFLARSFSVIQSGKPSFVTAMVPQDVLMQVRHSSVSGALREFVGHEGWLESFVQAFEVEKPDGEEFFLLVMPGEWILTSKRLYLLDRSHPPACVRLSEIERYSLRGLWTTSLDIRLTSGVSLRRPGSDFMTENEFYQCLAILKEYGAPLAAELHQVR